MTLKDYKEIETWAKNVVLGNGFSIGVSRHFSYPSLRDVCITNRYIPDFNNKLFDEFDSNDFEFLLDRLSIASSVNRVLGIYSTPACRYNAIRDALINAVRYILDKGGWRWGTSILAFSE